MRFAAILVVASLLAMSVLGQANINGVIGTRFPDARVVINQYFDAVAAKQIDASLRLFTPNATISVLDYGCFTGMDLARANTYFHGSTKWFNLLQRSLQEVVQVGSLAAASFTDAGIMPEAVQSKGMWNFLLNSMLMVNVNAFGELENLYLHTDFLNETAKAPYVKGVNNFFNTYCAGNVQAIEALFVPNAVIVNARHQTSPSQVVDQIQTINASTFASLPWALYQPQCGSMVTQIVAGCNLAIAQATVLMNIVGFAHEAQHGFWMFEFQFDNTTGAVTGIKRLEITINVAVN